MIGVLLLGAGFFCSCLDGRRRRRRSRTPTTARRRVTAAEARRGTDRRPKRKRPPAPVATRRAPLGRRRPAAAGRGHRRLRREQTVVLLFVRDGGIDDRLVRPPVAAARRASASVATFVVPAGQIARYAAITAGRRRRPRAGAGRGHARSSSTRASRPPRSATASRARRASSRPSSTPATRAGPSTTTRERWTRGTSRATCGRSPTPATRPRRRSTRSRAARPGLTPPLARGRSSGFVTDVLVDLGFVADERARQAIEEARTAGRPPEQLLLEQGAINADQLSRAVAERYGLDHVDLSAYQVDMAAANLISVNTARRYRALPVGFVDKETLLVAMADPTNVLAVDDIQIATGARLPRRGRRRGGHRGADRPPQHAAERRHRGGRPRARPRREDELAEVSRHAKSAPRTRR